MASLRCGADALPVDRVKLPDWPRAVGDGSGGVVLWGGAARRHRASRVPASSTPRRLLRAEAGRARRRGRRLPFTGGWGVAGCGEGLAHRREERQHEPDREEHLGDVVVGGGDSPSVGRVFDRPFRRIGLRPVAYREVPPPHLGREPRGSAPPAGDVRWSFGWVAYWMAPVADGRTSASLSVPGLSAASMPVGLVPLEGESCRRDRFGIDLAGFGAPGCSPGTSRGGDGVGEATATRRTA